MGTHRKINSRQLVIDNERPMIGDILIIDDKYEDITKLDNILRERGHTVRATRDGQSGLNAARSVKPDLILLDIMLPDYDGFRICELLRADHHLGDTPVIFVSALNDVNLKARAFAVGGYDYITKPYNDHEVLLRVQFQLERLFVREEIRKTAQFDERQHIARELHDSVSQTLFVLGARVQSLMLEKDTLAPEQYSQLEHINKLSKSALAEMRALLNELRPSHIQSMPIQRLLYQLIDSNRLRLDATYHTYILDVEIPDDIKLAVYRITQEALNNAAKHSQASQVGVHLFLEDSVVRLMIEDDGCGIDLKNLKTGIGLQSMRERAEKNNMSFQIISASNAGTRIEAVWPKPD